MLNYSVFLNSTVSLLLEIVRTSDNKEFERHDGEDLYGEYRRTKTTRLLVIFHFELFE
jgi:hypothetical protein